MAASFLRFPWVFQLINEIIISSYGDIIIDVLLFSCQFARFLQKIESLESLESLYLGVDANAKLPGPHAKVRLSDFISYNDYADKSTC